IVQIYQADVEGNAAYIAAEYCAGPNLDEWLQRRTMAVAPAIAAEIVANLADALGFAHDSGILHRDVKPGNVLLAVDVANDCEAPQHVRLADFGMARMLEQQDGTATADGTLIGSFAYMAPEQVHQSHGGVGPATDVHALGLLLYELLTLRKPFGGDDHSRILRRISEEAPKPPHELRPDIPRDLEAICLKCLEKSPGRRYRDGSELRDDLRRFLAGEPTLARPLSPLERGIQTARRHPLAVGVAAAVVAASIIAATAVGYHNRRLEELLRQANANLDLANERQAAVTDMLYVADMHNALAALQNGDPATVRRQLEKYRSQPEVRGIEWSFLNRGLCDPDMVLSTPGGPIYSSVLSPDGSVLATASQDGVVRLWDLASRQLAGELRGHDRDVNDVAFSADGRRLISSGEDGTARIWDVESRSLIQTLSDPGGVVYGVAFSPDGAWVAFGGKGKHVRLWNVSGAGVESLGPMEMDVESLVFSPDGRWLAAASGAAVHLWLMSDRATVRRLPVETPFVAKAAFSPDGSLIAGAGQDRKVYLWKMESGEQLAAWPGHRDSIYDVEFAPDGSGIVSCGKDGTVRFWPVPDAKGEIIRHASALEAQTGRLWSTALVNGGRTLIATGEDGGLRFWEMDRIHSGPEFGDTPQQIHAVEFSPDGKRLAAVRTDGAVAVWNTQRKSLETVLGPAEEPVSTAPRWTPDGRTIATGHDDGTLRLWPADGSAAPRTITAHTRTVTGVLISPTTPSTLHSCGYDGTLREWNVETGRQTHQVDFKVGEPQTIAISPDGGNLACDDGHNLVVWRLPEWRETHRIEEPRGRPASLEFSTDGRRLVSGHGDGAIQLWDLGSDAAPVELTRHTQKVMGATFSRDGRTIASASVAGSVRLWHVPTQQELGPLYRDPASFQALRFSADGRRLAAGYIGSDDQSGLLLWESE
ncbi:MAG: serine/threonine-protein kinase, partial [Planctomycetaceae bacterium]